MSIHHQMDKTLLTSHAGHSTANVLRNSVQMCDSHRIQQLVLRKKTQDKKIANRETNPQIMQQYGQLWNLKQKHYLLCAFRMCPCVLTGTFFCVTTTTQSFPLTATEVSPPWLMALKAYSEYR